MMNIRDQNASLHYHRVSIVSSVVHYETGQTYWATTSCPAHVDCVHVKTKISPRFYFWARLEYGTTDSHLLGLMPVIGRVRFLAHTHSFTRPKLVIRGCPAHIEEYISCPAGHSSCRRGVVRSFTPTMPFVDTSETVHCEPSSSSEIRAHLTDHVHLASRYKIIELGMVDINCPIYDTYAVTTCAAGHSSCVFTGPKQDNRIPFSAFELTTEMVETSGLLRS